MHKSQQHYLESVRAKTLFGLAAAATLSLIGILAATVLTVTLAGQEPVRTVLSLRWIQGLAFAAGIIGAPCALFLWFGMIWYRLSLDQNQGISKTIWLFLLVFANWLAAPVYYFLVYRRATG